ncbi:MAG: hypothetical protein KBC17_03995 [Candidatus Pacebacteria bacterium]|nr:hypothetical protein [Candidatus Paceibacterota bacterium]
MPLMIFVVLTLFVILANDFFAAERRADKKVESKIIKNVPPIYWSYKTIDHVINGDE